MGLKLSYGFAEMQILRKAFAVLALALVFLSGSTPLAFARDLARTDPDRIQILDAARQYTAIGTTQPPDGIKWVVRDLFRDGDFAYFCAARMTDGQIDRTDDAVDGYFFGLKRVAGTWSVVAEAGTFFSMKAKPSDCWYKERPIQTRADIANFLQVNAVDVARLKGAKSRE